MRIAKAQTISDSGLLMGTSLQPCCSPFAAFVLRKLFSDIASHPLAVVLHAVSSKHPANIAYDIATRL